MTAWSFDAVLDEIDDITSIDLLLDTAFTALKAVGIPRFIYIFLPQDTQYNQGVVEILHRGYSDDLLVFPDQINEMAKTDVGAKYLKLKAASTTKPFTKRDDHAESIFESVTPKDAKKATLWKHRDSFFIPVHSAHSTTGFFCLPPKPSEENSKRNRKLQSLCQSFHQKHCELWTLPENRQAKLTQREYDILLWVTLGKSNNVIADITGLSTHTVASYIRRLFLKLGVNDRVSAVIKAHEIGLLEEDIIRTIKAYL